MNKARRIGTAIAAPALSIAVVAGGVGIATSPAQAAPATKASKSKQVSVTAKGSKLSSKQTKAVVGVPQKIGQPETISSEGFRGYVTPTSSTRTM